MVAISWNRVLIIGTNSIDYDLIVRAHLTILYPYKKQHVDKITTMVIVKVDDKNVEYVYAYIYTMQCTC